MLSHSPTEPSDREPFGLRIPQPRNRYLALWDVFALLVQPFFLYSLRFEGVHWPSGEWRTAIVYAPMAVAIRLAIFWAFGLYRRLWRYASIAELERIIVVGAIAAMITLPLGYYFLPLTHLTPKGVKISLLFSDALLTVVVISIPRLLIRTGGWRGARRRLLEPGKRVLVVGAGAAGHTLVRELTRNSHLKLRPIGFLDDDPNKQRMHMADLPVLGRLSDIREVIERHGVDEVAIAMPTVPGSVVRPVVRAAMDAGIKARTIPALFEILTGAVRVGTLRQIEIHDLLRREPVATNLEEVGRLVTNQKVLVTGAGGSIGSELARQIANRRPSELIVLDHAENPIFYLANELRAAHPNLRIRSVIADVRDEKRIEGIFDALRPHTVFHAAAHKHVPLMEENIVEAVTNNVRGTHVTVHAAGRSGAQNFVLISTDKAVRPTSIMGATKRTAEHIVADAARQYGRNFVAVRFGNVLGSNGSVVPTFLAQIKAGGPVTVTHPDMKRYFMTIPEAVQLVLQAAALGRGGELFMLDMGEPVKIVDLAADLIRLSGYEVGVDVAIEYTGMRPGEKLYEEMFWLDEVAKPTSHPKILCSRTPAVENCTLALIGELLDKAIEYASEQELQRLLQAIVPDFKPGAADLPTPSFGVEIAGLRAAVPKRTSNPRKYVRPNEHRSVGWVSGEHIKFDEAL